MDLKAYPGKRVIEKKVWIFFVLLFAVVFFFFYKGLTGYLIQDQISENETKKDIAALCKEEFNIDKIACVSDEDCSFTQMNLTCSSKEMRLDVPNEGVSYCSDEYICILGMNQ